MRYGRIPKDRSALGMYNCCMGIFRDLFSPSNKIPLETKKNQPDSVISFRRMSATALTKLLHEALSATAAEEKALPAMQELLKEGENVLKERSKRGLKPIELRLLEWIRFLSRPDNLAVHLMMLTELTKILSRKFKIPQGAIQVTIYPTRGIYNFTRKPDRITLELHESLICMSSDERTAFVNALSRRNNAPSSKLMRTIFYSTDAQKIRSNFTEVHSQHDSSSNARGATYDLEQLFHEVNENQFQNQLKKPALKWSSRKSKTRYGSYNFRTDTLIINKALDNPKVPRSVVLFILYHELLHKALGFKTKNGIVRSHTAEFRRAEKAFPHYETIQSYLSNFQLHNTD